MKENFCQESKGTSELKPWLFGGIDSAMASYAGQPERAFISPMNIADMKAMGASTKVTMPQFAGGPAYLVVSSHGRLRAHAEPHDHGSALTSVGRLLHCHPTSDYLRHIAPRSDAIGDRATTDVALLRKQPQVCTHLHRECSTPYVLLASLFTTLRSSFTGSDVSVCYSRASSMVY